MTKNSLECLRVGVFCSAKDCIGKDILELGYEVGKMLAINGYDVVTGASVSGVMGTVANGVKENGGVNIGVYPLELNHLESPFPCDVLFEETKLIHRQEKLVELSDAFIILPGGTGTMYELFEVLTKITTGIKKECPVIILNHNGFYEGLIKLLVNLEKEKACVLPNSLFIARNIDDVAAILSDEIE